MDKAFKGQQSDGVPIHWLFFFFEKNSLLSIDIYPRGVYNTDEKGEDRWRKT